MTTPASTQPAPSAPETAVRRVTVQNRYGIHARPAALLVKAASKYPCLVVLEKDGIKVNAKSIMGLLTLEGAYGSPMTIRAEGPSASAAVSDLAALFENKFFED